MIWYAIKDESYRKRFCNKSSSQIAHAYWMGEAYWTIYSAINHTILIGKHQTGSCAIPPTSDSDSDIIIWIIGLFYKLIQHFICFILAINCICALSLHNYQLSVKMEYRFLSANSIHLPSTTNFKQLISMLYVYSSFPVNCSSHEKQFMNGLTIYGISWYVV